LWSPNKLVLPSKERGNGRKVDGHPLTFFLSSREGERRLFSESSKNAKGET
jgi:hypothetical protein